MMTLSQAAKWVTGARLMGDGTVAPLRVHTDTRTLRSGDLFVALKGERFDAHDFLGRAREQGAVAVIAQEGSATAGLPSLLVSDSRLALGQLAAGWRGQFGLPLIAVTGSNGKTTVTQMVAAILRAWKGAAAFSTEGNLNNDIGLPLTLLRLTASHEAGVVELGMNHPGEIAYLANIARPTVALVNNAQREHQEFMATVEAVARENGSVMASLDDAGIAVFPADDDYTSIWRDLAAHRRTLTFSDATGVAADVHGSAEWQDGRWQVDARTPAGDLAFSLGIAGRHNVRNAFAAIACALAAGVPLASVRLGLENFEPVKGRSRAFSLALGAHRITGVDDTYNANPDSVRAAVDVLAELPGPRLLVLGDMGEVGDQGPAFHTEIGDYARARGIEQVMTLGDQSRHIAEGYGGGQHFGDDFEALRTAVLAALPQTRSVLVKGSRFMKMERVVAAMNAFEKEKTEGTPHAA